MKTKQEIVENWLPRYTGLSLDKFGKYILLTNFQNYVDRFAEWQGVEVVGRDRSMPCATDGEITIINFSMGSANAATIMDLLSAIQPKAVLFLGKCGGIKKINKVGDLILPIAAIRGESVTMAATIGRERSTPPTAACGNTTTISRTIFARFAAWLWIWKPPPFSQSASTTKSRRVHSCWCPTTPWCPKVSRQKKATRWSARISSANTSASASTR